MKGLKFFLLLLSVVAWFGFADQSDSDRRDPPNMVDPNANRQTQALYENLKEISAEHILFGHQDDLAYGVTWKEWHKKDPM